MGLQIFPVFKPGVGGAELAAEGKALADEVEVLDRIAAEHGMWPFSSFADNRSVPEDFNGDPEELEERLGEWDEWFSIDEGLKVVEGLLHIIGQDSISASEFQHPEYVLEELHELERCLQIAKAQGAQFRLEMA